MVRFVTTTFTPLSLSAFPQTLSPLPKSSAPPMPASRRLAALAATFSAKWRRYVYLLPLTPSEDSPAFVGALDAVLSHLQGRKVCMSAFARDTPKGRCVRLCLCACVCGCCFVLAPLLWVLAPRMRAHPCTRWQGARGGISATEQQPMVSSLAAATQVD